MRRLSFLAVCMIAGMGFSIPAFVHAQEKTSPANIAEIKYDESLWSEVVLELYSRGTKILDPQTQLDIAPSPANDSEQTKRDLDTLAEYARTKRSDKVVEKILFENKPIAVVELFVAGGYLDKASNAKTYQLIEMADHEMQYFTVKYKKQFLRPRPNALRPELELVIPNPGHPAYPSGHGGQSWLVGLILSDIDPENKDAYMKFAKSIGVRREIAGVHYPSDTAAGVHLAEQVFRKLMENKTFAKKLSDSKESYVKPDLSKAYVVTELDETK